MDALVIERATRDERLLITLDRGLGDIRTYVPGSHAGVVVLRLANQSLESIDAAIQDLAARDLDTLAGALVVYMGSCVSAGQRRRSTSGNSGTTRW